MRIELLGVVVDADYGRPAATVVIDTDKGLLIVRESWDRAVYRLVPIEDNTGGAA